MMCLGFLIKLTFFFFQVSEKTGIPGLVLHQVFQQLPMTYLVYLMRYLMVTLEFCATQGMTSLPYWTN